MKLVHRSLYVSGKLSLIHWPFHLPKLELPIYGGLATTTSYRAAKGFSIACRRSSFSMADAANSELVLARDARFPNPAS